MLCSPHEIPQLKYLTQLVVYFIYKKKITLQTSPTFPYATYVRARCRCCLFAKNLAKKATSLLQTIGSTTQTSTKSYPSSATAARQRFASQQAVRRQQQERLVPRQGETTTLEYRLGNAQILALMVGTWYVRASFATTAGVIGGNRGS